MHRVKVAEEYSRRDNFEKRTREEGSRVKMSRTNESEYQVNKAGVWPNGLARGQTYDLG